MEKIHYLYIIGMIIISLISISIIILLPKGIPIPLLERTFFLFGLGLNTVILLWSICGFLFARWIKTGRDNSSLIIWSISFLIYSITFIAHILSALGFSFANENSSAFHFLGWRSCMIVWAAGIIYGTLKILTENKNIQLTPSIIVLIGGFLSFWIGLFIIDSANPIETTMYIFLYIIWIPICFSMAYIFFYYGYKTLQIGPKLVSLGFIGLTITYMQWAPWHYQEVIYIYFIWYFLFLLSLTPILIGFVVMSFEEH